MKTKARSAVTSPGGFPLKRIIPSRLIFVAFFLFLWHLLEGDVVFTKPLVTSRCGPCAALRNDDHDVIQACIVYTKYPIVARALGIAAAFRPGGFPL